MDGILPAAGLASRMRGIPKFLLPCDDVYTTLIEKHIIELGLVCETIWIPTRPDLVTLLESLSLPKDRVVILPIKSNSMSETVKYVVDIARADCFQLIMPDTFFQGGKPYTLLSEEPEFVNLACWRIREEQRGKLGQVKLENGFLVDIVDKDPNCNYEFSWGGLSFRRELLDYCSLEDPHIGYGVKNALLMGKKISATKIEGEYFDCGTPTEYLDMLRRILT